MTEEEWLASVDPRPMLKLIRDWASQRKLRLYACGCCRISLWFMSLHGAIKGVEATEQWADGLARRSDVYDAALPIDVFSERDEYDFSHSAVEKGLCSEDPYVALQYAIPWVHQRRDVRNLLCSDLLRCVFGNPFDYHPPPVRITPPPGPVQRLAKRVRDLVDFVKERGAVQYHPDSFQTPSPQPKPASKVNAPPKLLIEARSWLTSDVIALARQMYESRDFSAMPILADAFQDAGCDNDDILNHCRDTYALHVRGCWVVDLVLGKE